MRWPDFVDRMVIYLTISHVKYLLIISKGHHENGQQVDVSVISIQDMTIWRSPEKQELPLCTNSTFNLSKKKFLYRRDSKILHTFSKSSNHFIKFLAHLITDDCYRRNNCFEAYQSVGENRSIQNHTSNSWEQKHSDSNQAVFVWREVFGIEACSWWEQKHSAPDPLGHTAAAAAQATNQFNCWSPCTHECP